MSVVQQDELELPYANALQYREYDPDQFANAEHAVRIFAQEQAAQLQAVDLSNAEREQLEHKAQLHDEYEAVLQHRADNARSVMQECSMWWMVAESTSNSSNNNINVNAKQDANIENKSIADQPTIVKDIFHAACDGDVRSLQEHHNKGTDINCTGQPNPIKYNGVQFTQRWTFRATPLIFAVAFHRERAVEALLSWHANPFVKSSTGLTPLDYARAREYDNIAHMLENAVAKYKYDEHCKQ